MTFRTNRRFVLVVLDDFFAVGHELFFAIDHSLVNPVWFSAIATQSWKYRPLLSRDQTGGSCPQMLHCSGDAFDGFVDFSFGGVPSQGQTQ